MKKLLFLAFITISTLFSSAQTTYGIQFSDANISRWPSGINSMTSKGWEYSNSIVFLGFNILLHNKAYLKPSQSPI